MVRARSSEFVAELAVVHGQQGQYEVGLTETGTLVVYPDEDLSDVLLGRVTCCCLYANVDRRKAVLGDEVSQVEIIRNSVLVGSVD